MQENKKYHYSILNTFIGLIFLFFILVLFCLGWEFNELESRFEESELKVIAKNINNSISELILSHRRQLELLGRVVTENKYYDDQSKMNYLTSLLVSHENNSHNFLDRAIWEPNDIKFKPINYQAIKMPYMTGLIKDEKGSIKGRVLTEINKKYFKEYIERIISDKEMYYTLISKDSFDVFDSNFPSKKNMNKKIFSLINQLQTESIPITISDHDFYYCVNYVNDLNIALVIAKPQDNIYFNQINFLFNYRLEITSFASILILLFYIFYRAILAPFILLSNAALEISNGNTPLIPPKISYTKEGLLVAAAMNKIKSSLNSERDLVQEITKAHNKLSITNLRLENKVTSRTQELEQALQVKDRFISYLTYELKTPLKGLTNLVQSTFLKWPDLSDNQKTDFSQHILYTLNRIMSLVNGMLSISNLNSGNITLNLSNFCLTDLVKEIITECTILHLNKKNININFFCEEKFFILADRDKITQIVRNIIVNSIERSDNNSSIAIQLNKSEILDEKINIRENAIQFSLHDNSKEMSPEMLSNIFSNKNIKIENIPLNISNELILLHSGRIWANNNNDGGITINFIIPTQQLEVITGKSNPNYIDLHPSKYNILMIDDEELCTTGMEIQLRNTKYNLIKCNNAQAGLDYLSKNYEKISIIMLDLMMPDIYGLNVLNEIRSNINYKNISIILQTGSTDEEEIVKAFNIGINGFIKKPYNKKIILKELEKALRLNILNKRTDGIPSNESGYFV